MPFAESPKETLSVIRNFLKDDKSVASKIPVEIEQRLKAAMY
jgi:hypothetical protein